MTIAEGLRLGQQNNITNYGIGRSRDPLSAIPELAVGATAARRNPNAVRRTSPASIWENAAFLANQRKQLELKEREIALGEEREMNRQNEARYARERTGRIDLQNRGRAIEDQYQSSMDASQKRYVGDVAIGQSQDAARSAEKNQQQRSDFAAAQRGLATKDAEPIIRYFNDYGSPNANISDIRFDPEGGPEIMVFPENTKAGIHFANADEFYKKFLGVGSPDIQKELYDRSLKEREQTRKEKETEYKTGGGKGRLTPKDERALNIEAEKAFNADKTIRDPAGNLKPGVTREGWIRNYKTRVLGAGQEATPGAGGASPSTRAKWSEKYQSWLVPVPGGGFKKVSGPKEYKAGEMGPEEKGPKVRRPMPKDEAIEEKPISKRQAQVTKSRKKLLDRGKAIPDKKKEQKQTGSVYYTDKKTGDKIKKTMYSDGSVVTVTVKKKKKKKKKNGDKD